MKRIFLDTNILMDVAENREHAPEANLLLDLGFRGIIQVCVAPITYTTMSFLLHRFDKKRIHEILRQLSEGIEVLPMDAAQFLQAMSFGPVRDFEDMMQYQLVCHMRFAFVLEKSVSCLSILPRVRMIPSHQVSS